MGLANVLSTTTIAPTACAASATSWMSTHDTSGFDGVSKKTKRVLLLMQAIIACAVAAVLEVTTTPAVRS
jgi:hypothetical protein